MPAQQKSRQMGRAAYDAKPLQSTVHASTLETTESMRYNGFCYRTCEHDTEALDVIIAGLMKVSVWVIGVVATAKCWT